MERFSKPAWNELDRKLRLRVFLRSLLIQGCWNNERMQNLGFAFCLEPWLRRIAAAGGPPSGVSLARHLEYFNTQPYMASFVLGITGRLEEELASRPAAERAAAEARVSRMKAAFGAALAGIGDALFWATLRPFCAALAIAAWLVLWTGGSPHPTGWALAAYLAAYNVPAFWVRWIGIGFGYAWGEAAALELKRFRWQQRIKALRGAGLALGVGLVGCALVARPWGTGAAWSDAAVIGAALLVRGLGWPTPRIYTVSLGAAMALAMAGG